MNDAIRISEQERTLHSARPMNPQSEIWKLLRDQADGRRADREAGRRRLAEERVPLAELVVAVVNLQHQLTAFERTNGAALAEAGARVLAPADQAWDPDDASWADIVASEPDPAVDEPVIRETVVPGVWLRGELLQRAAVVVVAPPREAAPEN